MSCSRCACNQGIYIANAASASYPTYTAAANNGAVYVNTCAVCNPCATCNPCGCTACENAHVSPCACTCGTCGCNNNNETTSCTVCAAAAAANGCGCTRCAR